MQHQDGTLAVGQVLGPYPIKRVLGARAFGVVYEALTQPPDKRVALKFLPRARASGPFPTPRFLLTVPASANPTHPTSLPRPTRGSTPAISLVAP